MTSKAQEVVFQNGILDQMQSHGWLLGESKNYNKKLALYPEDLIAFVKDTQQEQWDKFAKIYPKNTEESL